MGLKDKKYSKIRNFLKSYGKHREKGKLAYETFQFDK
jgi:hypothetical protein